MQGNKTKDQIKEYIAKHSWNFMLTVFFLVFFVKAQIFLDPDFGWHIKTGQLILQQGFPRTDPFSYTMPDYPYVDHSWGTDVFIALVYPIIGKIGLSIIFSCFVIATLWMLRPKNIFKSTKPLIDGSLFLVAGTLLPPFGVRIQVISWFLFVLVLKLVFDNKLWIKFRFLLPFLFFVWANLHGGFFVGFFVIVMFCLARFIKKRQIGVRDCVIVLFSVLATFVNPYGLSLWGIVLTTIINTQFQSSIAEWQPAYTVVIFPVLMLFVLSSLSIWKYRRKINLEYILIYLLLTWQAYSHIRQEPLWSMVAFLIFVICLNFFYNDIKKDKIAIVRLQFASKIAFYFFMLIFVLQAFSSVGESFFLTEKSFYPTNAIVFLKNYPSSGQVFSDYGWGGYIIWKIPEKKTFIDGRMDVWGGAMKDYLAITKDGDDPIPYFDKYNVDTVLWPFAKTKETILSKFLGNLENKLSSFLHKKTDKKVGLVEKLQALGWKEIYKDDISVILKRPN